MKKSTMEALKRSMAEGLQIARGQDVEGAVTTEYVIHEPEAVTAEEVREIRQSLAMSQPVFAQILGVSVNALRNWEQGRNAPSPIACRFLTLIRNDPEFFIQQIEDLNIIEPL